MAELKISQATTTDFSSVQHYDRPQFGNDSIYKDFWQVTERDTDGANGKTAYISEWSKWHGYYRQVAVFATAIDKLASWTIGRGYKANSINKKKIERITGWGKDDFSSIIENLLRTALINGDSFAQIIKDKKSNRLLNLKILGPSSIKIMVLENGIISHYEQINQKGETTTIFKKDEILHLCFGRIANEIHGIPYAERVEYLLKMIMEAQLDQKVMFHRYVVPITIIPVDADNETDVTTITGKLKTAFKKVEPLVVPKDTLNPKDIGYISIPQFSIHDPLPWLKYLTRSFITAIGVPEVVMGWGEQTTEASSKIIYLAFQQTIERFQLMLEVQLKLQVGIEINLEFPASIEPELQKDEKKDGEQHKKFSVDVMKQE